MNAVPGDVPTADDDRHVVTRRAPRSLTLGEVPDDSLPKLINEDADGTGDCSMCGSLVRRSGWLAHWDWHHNVEGYGFPKGYRLDNGYVVRH